MAGAVLSYHQLFGKKKFHGTQMSRAILAILALVKWAIQSHLDKAGIADIAQLS